MADLLPSDEQVEEPSDYGVLRPGTRLGRYELLVPIARGGMARVWAARLHGQPGFQRLVAIKVILPSFAGDPELERMFLDEARIASGVHHPNVCEIYELGEEKTTLYLAMEWVSGDSFSRLLRASGGETEAVEPRVVARIVADACAGVHAAHELTDEDGRPLGVVHRDLSPQNILLTAAGTTKVCDFGVAKALNQLHEATSAGQLKGKISYMAPEQITGAPVDRRSDVFSLGCVLYEATTGQRPFRGDGDHEVMHAVLRGEIISPTSIIRNYPPELERIVMRALAPQPMLRFPTAERMRCSLEEFVARGQLVTRAHVAQVLKMRIGDLIEQRNERIRQASAVGDRKLGWSEPPGGMTPANEAHGRHRLGVKSSGSQRPPPQTMASPVTAALPYLAPSSAPPHPPPNALAGTALPEPITSQPPPHPGSPPPHYQQHYLQQQQQHQQQLQYGSFQAPAVQPPFDVSRFDVSLAPPISGPYRLQSQPPAVGRYALAVLAGMLVAVLIGGAAFLLWRAKHTLQPEAGAPAATSTTATGQATPTSLKTVTPASTEIVFRLAPVDATLSVDGKNLPPSTRVVPRPAIGMTVNVVVRADGYEDLTVLVDFFSRSPMDLTLKPAADASTAAAPADATSTAAPDESVVGPPLEDPAPSNDPVKKPPRPPKDLGLPANPY